MQNHKGQLVVISQNKDKNFPVWKVEHGSSCVVFASYDEAMDYCRGRFLDIDEKVVK